MDGLARSVQWIWAISVAAQVAVCGVLLLKGHFRKLRVFTAFIAVNLSQAGFLYLVYARFGAGSHTSLVLAWSSEAITLLLKALATTEILWLVLRPYRGIWGLAWRVLGVTFGCVFSYALIQAGRNVTWAIILADRGFHLAFAVALAACLLVVRYYSIPMQWVYKALLGGLCLNSCTVVLTNTLGGLLVVRRLAHFSSIWQVTTILSYAIVQVGWAVALRRPLPAEENEQALLEDPVYQEVSPEINHRLRLLNEQLLHIWEPEATRR